MTVTGALVALCLTPPVHASAATTGGTTVTTLPATAGFAFTFHGTAFRTGPDGRVRVPGLAADQGGELSSTQPVTTLIDGSQLAFDRFYDAHEIAGGTITAALRSSQRVTLGFADLSHQEVPSTTISDVALTSSDGHVVALPVGAVSTVLPAREVVLRSGALSVQNLTYRLTKATAAGRSVLTSGPATLTPATQDEITFDVALASTAVHVRDALFGFSIGSALHLTPASGASQTLELGDGGRLTLTGLQPGTYRLSVDGVVARGSRTVTVPGTRTVDLAIVTWVDLLVLVGAAALLVLGAITGVRRIPRNTRPVEKPKAPVVEPYPTPVAPPKLIVLQEAPALLASLPTQVHGPFVIRTDRPPTAVAHEHPTLNRLPEMPH